MKLTIVPLRIATLGVLAASFGMAIDDFAIALFASTVAVFILLIIARDYTRRPSYAAVIVKNSPLRATLPLAA